MINRTYSILMKGVQPTSGYYCRKCITEAYSENRTWGWFGDMLVPTSKGAGYRQYCAEQLVQIIRKSPIRNDFNAFDPVNTYGSEFSPPAPSGTITGLPTGYRCDLLEPSGLKEWVELDTSLEIDPSGWQGDDSEIISAAPGLDMMLHCAAGSSKNTFSLELDLVRPPVRDLKVLFDSLKGSSLPWHEDYIQYKDNMNPDTWMAAALLSYCRRAAR